MSEIRIDGPPRIFPMSSPQSLRHDEQDVWLPSISDQASIILCQTEGQLTASNGMLSNLSDLVEISKRNALLLGAKPVQVCARLGKDVVPEPAAVDYGLIMRREFTTTRSTAEVQVSVSWYPSRKNR